MRTKRLLELSTKDKKGNPKISKDGSRYEISEENQKVLITEIADFVNEEVEFEKITISEIEGVSMSAGELIALDGIIGE